MTYQIKNIKKISHFYMLKSCDQLKNNTKFYSRIVRKKIEFISTPYDYENAKFLAKLE